MKKFSEMSKVELKAVINLWVGIIGLSAVVTVYLFEFEMRKAALALVIAYVFIIVFIAIVSFVDIKRFLISFYLRKINILFT